MISPATQSPTAALFDRLEQHVGRDPEKTLFSFLDMAGEEVEHHSYGSFWERVETVASHIRERAAPGERALLVYPPGLEMICALFACARAGVIPVPTAPATAHGSQAPLVRMSHIAADSQASVLLTDRGQQGRLHTALDRNGVDLAAVRALTWHATDDWRTPAGPPPPLADTDVFLLQYTSGSTSNPKGVVVSPSNILHNCDLVVDHPSPVAVSWLPQHHDMGLLGYYVYLVLSGGTTYGFSPTTFIQRPGLWLETISQRRGTATSAPNFAYQYCLRPGRLPQATLDELDLSSLRFLMAAAEPIKVDTYRRFLRAFEPYGLSPESFFVAYGLAENTLAVTNYGRRALSLHKRELAAGRARPVEDVSEVASAVHLMSCGIPLGDTTVEIVDPETRAPAAAGAVGEIWVAGGSTCAAYWGAPEASERTFHARLADGDGTPFLRTGDLGFLHDGELYVCGRQKDVIILRGRNLYPQDIEAVVERVAPQVREGYVAAFELDGEAEASVGIVAEIRNRKRLPDARAIITAVGDQLDAPVGLVAFVPSKSIPRTSSGKIVRHETRRMWHDGEFEVLGHVAHERSAHDAADLAYAGGSAFGYSMHAIAHRYGIGTGEPVTLIEAGIDSVDLVTLMLEVKEVLRGHGAAVFADQVDVRLLQRLTIAELFQIVDAFERDPEAAVGYLRGHLQEVREAYLEEERAMMEADRTLPFEPPAITGPPRVPAREILVTGGTGFLGPFLLHSLLEQTDARVQVLVRAASPEAARDRLRAAFAAARDDADALAAFDDRVTAICGDLERPALGLSPEAWDRLAATVDAIYHNGAAVNYLLNYSALRAANVAGTAEALRLAFQARPAVFNLVSTTFIFGWATKETLLETDANAGMELLDFGYSQSKWVAEQLVADAARHGLPTRVFRPALITPSLTGGGASADITMRLLAFMITHGIGVSARNQVSFVPADTTGANIAAIGTAPDTVGGTFHVVRDDYAHMTDITDLISRLTGQRFTPFALPAFVPEVVRRCTRDDLLYPLLNFLIRSVDNISAMEFKRYDSARYQAARDASPGGVPDPSLEDTVAGILRFLQRTGMV